MEYVNGYGINRQSILVTLVWFQWAAYILAIPYGPYLDDLYNMQHKNGYMSTQYLMMIIIYRLKHNRSRLYLQNNSSRGNTSLSFNRCIPRLYITYNYITLRE